MDVEGVDGRERGDDNTFERRSSLFALAVSEVLIINMWDKQVGLRDGANHSLLRTLLEVNAQLFLNSSRNMSRTLFYFVLRDFDGQTSLHDLREIIVENLARIWDDVTKPQGLKSCPVSDLFDIAVASLPHKVLHPNKFVDAIASLATDFRTCEWSSTGSKTIGLLKEDYHRHVPADGFCQFVQNVWTQISEAKDLDFPAQYEMLATFRCDQILSVTKEFFSTQLVTFERDLLNDPARIPPGLGRNMLSARSRALESFKEAASRYYAPVFNKKLEELREAIDPRLQIVLDGFVKYVSREGLRTFSSESEAIQGRLVSLDNGRLTGHAVKDAYKRALSGFQEHLQCIFVTELP